MSIVVTTPTGNIGRVVVEELLKAGEKPLLLVRHPEKVADFVQRGAGVVQGSMDDPAFLKRATQGAEALFWLTPNDPTTGDLAADQARFARAAAQAIEANEIPRVVNLSSIGAHRNVDGGPVNGLHGVESILDETEAAITHLRPAYFMENYLDHLPNIVSMGKVFLPAPANARLPMVATRDIGLLAACELMDESRRGRRVQGIHGPTDLSFGEAATILSEALARPVEHVQVRPEEMKAALLQLGMSEHVADLLVELNVNIGNGKFRGAEPRTASTTTSTTFAQFVESSMKPAVRAMEAEG